MNKQMFTFLVHTVHIMNSYTAHMGGYWEFE